MKQISEPSHLHVQGCGHLAAIGWQLSFSSVPNAATCVTFTPDNLGPKRADDFHKGLLATVRKTYEDTELSWVPIAPTKAN